APSPGRRPAALRCTGVAGAVVLPVSGRDSGTAGVGAVRVADVAGEGCAVTAVAGLGSVGADGSASAAGVAEGGAIGSAVRGSDARWTGGSGAPPGCAEDGRA
ncbi:hypothetical protein GTY88_07735, partial [Streptomyces sp. SID5926]|nr:hypothetical protein [Streptomyces sp. SID5926]